MQNPKRSGISWKPSLLIIFFIFAAFIFIFLIYLGLTGYQATPKYIHLNNSYIPPGSVQYSEEQQTVLSQFGRLNYFSIQFYDDWLDNGILQTIRVENWGFESHGQEITFLNGVLLESTGIDIPAQASLPLTYSPDQFHAYMSLQEISAVTGVTELIEMPMELELLPGGKIYFGPGITFGLKNNQLIYIEAFSQIDNGGQS